MEEKNKTTESFSDISAIYEEYNKGLKGFIAKRVNFKEDVEDILQNVFYKLALTNLEDHPIEHISSWLYSVAQNQIIDHYRKKKSESFSSIEEENEGFIDNLMQALNEDSDSPEMKFLQSLVWVELENALDELPPEQRKVFELTEFEGFSFKEISEATGFSVNTLLSRKRYAILYLRSRLKDLYDEIIFH